MNAAHVALYRVGVHWDGLTWQRDGHRTEDSPLKLAYDVAGEVTGGPAGAPESGTPA